MYTILNKMYQLMKHAAGYIIGFEVYTGKGTSSAADLAILWITNVQEQLH